VTHHDDDVTRSRDGLSFRDAEDRTAIIIGHPRHFKVIVEIFGGTERYRVRFDPVLIA